MWAAPIIMTMTPEQAHLGSEPDVPTYQGEALPSPPADPLRGLLLDTGMGSTESDTHGWVPLEAIGKQHLARASFFTKAPRLKGNSFWVHRSWNPQPLSTPKSPSTSIYLLPGTVGKMEERTSYMLLQAWAENFYIIDSIWFGHYPFLSFVLIKTSCVHKNLLHGIWSWVKVLSVPLPKSKHC